MQGVLLRKYGVEFTVNFELHEVDGINFRVDAVHASGDIKVMKDEGAEATSTNGFTDEGTGYSVVLTATEAQAARIVLYIADQTGTKVWLDKSIVIETYGNASAMHAFDLDTASTAQTGDGFARLGAPAGASVSDDIAVIESQTDDIGVAGAGLTNLGGMSTGMKAEVNTEADTALADDPSIAAILVDTSTTLPAHLTDIKGTGFIKDTHSLTDVEAFVDGLELTIGTAGAGLSDLGGMSTAMKAEMVVEINNALDAAIAELGVGVPSATPSIRNALMLMYMALRNQLIVQTSGTPALEVYNNAGTKIVSKLLSDDGTDYTESGMS